MKWYQVVCCFQRQITTTVVPTIHQPASGYLPAPVHIKKKIPTANPLEQQRKSNATKVTTREGPYKEAENIGSCSLYRMVLFMAVRTDSRNETKYQCRNYSNHHSQGYLYGDKLPAACFQWLHSPVRFKAVFISHQYDHMLNQVQTTGSC